MKLGVSVFNEFIIYFYIIAIYMLTSIDDSELIEKYSVGKFILFAWLLQRIGNSIILCLIIYYKGQLIIQKLKSKKTKEEKYKTLFDKINIKLDNLENIGNILLKNFEEILIEVNLFIYKIINFRLKNN